MLRFVALFCVVALVNGQTTPVDLCTANSGLLPMNTYIEGCDSLPCDLPQLQDAEINIIFRAPWTINRMRTLATAHLPGMVALPYPLQANSETCNFLTSTKCPVKKDEIVQYALKMFIQPSFPVGVESTIEFRINDVDRNSSVVCIRVPVRIVGPVNSGVRDNNVNIA
ncbi:NPC intracellular cholesterol transporter 2-like [Trichoplusia ni]|uniref:NPC intracellular cholesterol transporter 2-like n=1 Tax=Trichoplusia ni TaxID=7111 RepID=A0A7E5WIM9_TRINI|nr:NPC intracellular cholesterol transporter 2-like [Trichoplusia ni]